MIIPTWKGSGFPTVSPTMLRKYGYGGDDELNLLEEPRGCPRQFQALYVDHSAEPVETWQLRYGRVMHDVFQNLEADMDPEEALAAAWDPELGIERYAEALEDIRNFVSRETSPLEQYLTLQPEIELSALLYVDEQFGPIWIRARLDRLALDPFTPNVVHVVDYKSDRHPPATADVMVNLQFLTQVWLVIQNWSTIMPGRPLGQVIFHLDAIKWRELPPVRFSTDDLDAWHGWVVSAVKKILRDEEAAPVLNSGCAYCPIKDTCPAYLALPDHAEALLGVKPTVPEGKVLTYDELVAHRDQLMRWRDKANDARLLLEKAVADVDQRFDADAALLGFLRAGGWQWKIDTKWIAEVDVRTLHAAIGDRFYDLVTVSKKALEEVADTLPPGERERVLRLRTSRPSGTKVKRTKE